MPTTDLDGYDTTKSIATFHRMAQIALGTMVPPAYNYHAIRRLIEVDEDESVDVASDDPLGEALLKAASGMKFTERVGQIETEVDPTASIATLFDGNSPFAKALHPKLYLAYDLRKASTPICAILTACDFTRDESLSTSRITATFCTDNNVPRIGSNWLLCDVVVSNKRYSGALLVLQVYLLAMRSKKTGVCAVAVTKAGKNLFESLGFRSVSFREGGVPKAFMYAKAGSLSMEQINRRLSFAGDKTLLQDLCFRFGLTRATSSKVMGRC